MLKLFLDNSPERLEPLEFFTVRGAPSVKTAFDSLLLAEACYERVTEYAGTHPTVASAFINAYFDLWERVVEVHAGLLEQSLAPAEDQAAASTYLLRLPRDLAALKEAIGLRRAKSLASDHGPRGVQTSLYWLRGDGKPGVGLFPLFQKDEPQTPKGHPPFGWLRVGRLLGANPAGPGGMYAIAFALSETAPDSQALAAFRLYEETKESRDTLAAERALAKAHAKRDYMREYQRKRRQAARELLEREQRAIRERDATLKAEHESRMARAYAGLAPATIDAPDPLS